MSAFAFGCGFGFSASIVPSGSRRYVFNRAPVLPSGATLTRNSANGTYFDSDRNLQIAAANIARFTHNPSTGALRGLLNEPDRTNGARINTGAGAVTGPPGTLPTNVTTSGGAGLTRTISPSGIENGIEYWEVRYTGTPSSTLFINLESGTQIAAASGQSWLHSIYPKLSAGSVTGTTFSVNLGENNSGGSGLAATGEIFVPTNADIRTQRVSVFRLFNQATTAYALPYVRISFTGVAVDFTLRIGLTQPEQGAARSSVIKDTGSAGTRAADVLTLSVAPGMYDIAIVRESGTTTLPATVISGTSYVVPTDVSPLQSVDFIKSGIA